MKISKRRQKELEADCDTVRVLYQMAIEKWGKEKLYNDHTRLWDLRCQLGMAGAVPFRTGLVSQNLGEMLFVAEELCGLWKEFKLRITDFPEHDDE